MKVYTELKMELPQEERGDEMEKQAVTVEEFIERCKPCWGDDMIREAAGGKEEWTAADVLRLEGPPPKDRLWAALKIMAMTGRSKEAAQFARWCAEEALTRAEEAADAAGGADPRLRERVGAMRRFLADGASLEDADAARELAREAREAAWEAHQALAAPLAASQAACAAARTVKAAAWAAVHATDAASAAFDAASAASDAAWDAVEAADAAARAAALATWTAAGAEARGAQVGRLLGILEGKENRS
jgi:hypothetical protein